MLIYSRPSIPDRTKYILGESTDSPYPYLLDTGEKLMSWGADCLAIPCITAHFFQEELHKAGLPVINALTETAEYLKEEGIQTAGILATDGTIHSRLFQNAFSAYGIRCVTPDASGQKKVMRIIYEAVKAGKEPDLNDFHEVQADLIRQGAEAELLGCTELSILKRDYEKELGDGVLDVMEVLARTAVLECGTLKKEYSHLLTGRTNAE